MADQDIADLTRFANRIRRAPEKAEAAFIPAIKAGAEVARERGVDQIHKELNLERSYIADNLEVTTKPKSGDLRAVISGRSRPTQLTRYGGNKIATKAAKSKRRKLRGDSRRGIRKGQKADGIKAFAVQRGGKATRWAGGFIVFLKNGNVGLATRTGKGRDDYELNYGTSVGSAWKSVRGDIAPLAFEEVEKRFVKEFGRKL